MKKIAVLCLTAVLMTGCTSKNAVSSLAGKESAASDKEEKQTEVPSLTPEPTPETVDYSTLQDKEVPVDYEMLENISLDDISAVSSYAQEKGYSVNQVGLSVVVDEVPEKTDWIKIEYEFYGDGTCFISVVPVDQQYANTWGYYPDSVEFWHRNLEENGYTKQNEYDEQGTDGTTIHNEVYSAGGRNFILQATYDGDTFETASVETESAE